MNDGACEKNRYRLLYKNLSFPAAGGPHAFMRIASYERHYITCNCIIGWRQIICER